MDGLALVLGPLHREAYVLDWGDGAGREMHCTYIYVAVKGRFHRCLGSLGRRAASMAAGGEGAGACPVPYNLPLDDT